MRDRITQVLHTIFRLSLLLWSFVVIACDPNSAEGNKQPSKELYQVLHLFIEADTLNQYPKFYAAVIKQELPVGNTSVYLVDEYNSDGNASVCPSATWVVDKKVFFVYSGLEALSLACDTAHYTLVKDAHSANNSKIWSPPYRCWKVQVQHSKIVAVDKQPDLLDFFGGPLGPPPPVPDLKTP